MRGLFITGTDTGVGKSVITGCLARYLQEKGYNVITQKWIQTGCSLLSSSDVYLHLKIMGHTLDYIKNHRFNVVPYIFKTACSPHLAARIEKKKIFANKIIESFKLLTNRFGFVVVEGIGGALVPFNKNRLVIDIVKGLNLPVLVVAENRLGAINHTLLTIEALKTRKINILGIIFNNIKKENSYILKDNPRIIKSLTAQEILGLLPFGSSYEQIYRGFISIGNKIFKVIK